MSSEPEQTAYHTVTPYLVVPGVPALIDFARQAFGAVELQRHQRPDGTIMHAEIKIGDSVVMMGESNDEFTAMPASLYLLAEDVDATYARAMEAGATSLRAPEEQSYGRSAGVRDAGGNLWWITSPSQAS
jgi:PhnB protein